MATDEPQHPDSPVEESTGNAALDRRLEKGVVDFNRGIDTAQVWVSAFLIVIVGLVAYLGVFRVPFQGAETAHLRDNPALHRVTTFLDARETDATGPLALFSHALNWRITPGMAWGFRAVSLALHLLSGVSLYLFARRLLGAGFAEPVAMAAGLVFVVHPLATENVANALGRPGPLALCLALLSALLFFRATDERGASPHPTPLPEGEAGDAVVAGLLRAHRSFSEGGTEPPAGPRVSALSLAGSLACYALAFAAEPTAIVLPVILFWADWVRGGWPRLRACGAVHGLYGLFSIALMLVRVASGGDGGTEYLRAPGAVFGALTVYLERLLPHVFWPVALNPIAPSVAGMAISSLGLGILACLMVAAVLLIAVRGIGGVALLWPLAAACAAVCLLPSDDLLTARRAYFAMAGFALLAPWLFSVVTPRLARTALGLIVAGCVLASGVLTYQRLVLWSEPVRLWPPAADAVPDDARPWEYLGTLAVESARSAANAPEARAHWMAADRCWREALHRKPGDVSYRGKLGMTLRQLGRDAEAMTELRDVLRRNPFDQAAALQIALLHEARTRGAVLAAFDEARARAGWSPQIGEEFVRRLRAHPDGPDVAAHFALLFEAWGRTGHDIEPLRLAAQYFARARALGELPVEALARYAAVLAGIGDVVSCAGVLSEAARGAPEGALKAVAERFARLAGQAAAIEARAQALLVTPDRIIEGMRVMGEAALLRGEWTQAGYLLETAIEKEPANETTWLSLGYLRACTGAADAFVRDHGGDAVATPEAWSRLATRCMAGGSWETAESYLGHNADLGDEVRRSLALGKIALEVGRAERAAHYFDKAVNVRPDDSAPWLELCDIAIEHGDGAGAARYLGEAERRGAASEDVAARREKIKERGGPTAPETTPRTIIR